MIDKNSLKLDRVISHETKYVHLMEANQEVELRFVLASLKDETFHASRKSQPKISSKRWKMVN
jgi:hypothetical protein